jgi:hypothetical protein
MTGSQTVFTTASSFLNIFPETCYEQYPVHNFSAMISDCLTLRLHSNEASNSAAPVIPVGVR